MIENCQKVYQDRHIQIHKWNSWIRRMNVYNQKVQDISLLNVNWIYGIYIESAKLFSSRIP